MELLIALMISLGSISADDAIQLKGNDAKTIQMAEQSGIDRAKIDNAKAEIVGLEETDM